MRDTVIVAMDDVRDAADRLENWLRTICGRCRSTRRCSLSSRRTGWDPRPGREFVSPPGWRGGAPGP